MWLGAGIPGIVYLEGVLSPFPCSWRLGQACSGVVGTFFFGRDNCCRCHRSTAVAVHVVGGDGGVVVVIGGAVCLLAVLFLVLF